MRAIVNLENAPEVLSRMGLAPRHSSSPMRDWCAVLVAGEFRPVPTIAARTAGCVSAIVNNNRWIVKCPYCAGAMLASKHDPIFWCVNCENQANQGLPMAVHFPKNRELIEWVLMKRPDPTTRNWIVTETVADLIRDNKAHGVN
jgi:hypothetical protein